MWWRAVCGGVMMTKGKLECENVCVCVCVCGRRKVCVCVCVCVCVSQPYNQLQASLHQTLLYNVTLNKSALVALSQIWTLIGYWVERVCSAAEKIVLRLNQISFKKLSILEFIQVSVPLNQKRLFCNDFIKPCGGVEPDAAAELLTSQNWCCRLSFWRKMTSVQLMKKSSTQCANTLACTYCSVFTTYWYHKVHTVHTLLLKLCFSINENLINQQLILNFTAGPKVCGQPEPYSHSAPRDDVTTHKLPPLNVNNSSESL